MPIMLPNLDDRRWADLVEEGRALLPVVAPAWTDHNVSDPGITLIELFAWLAEQSTYRLNRVATRHRTKFLELVRVLPRPVRAARAVLTLRLEDAQARPVAVPATTEFVSADGLIFHTLHPLTVGRARLGAVQGSDGVRFRAVDSGALEGLLPFGADPRPGACLYLGIDLPLSAGETLSLHVSLGEPDAADVVRASIAAELASRRAACEAGDPCVGHAGEASTDEPGADQLRAVREHHSVRLTWEYREASGRWLPLRFRDGTRGFSLDGLVELEGPRGPGMASARVGSVLEPYYYVRCRLTGGLFDAAPRLHGLYLHAVEAEQSRAVHGPRTEDGVLIGTGRGEPHQRIRLPTAPVLLTGLRVWSEPAGQGPEAWEPRADLAASRATDRHFVFDSALGELRFGDGRNGRAPARDEVLRATFRATDAERGNLTGQAALSLAGSAHNALLALDSCVKMVKVGMPRGSLGGAAAETLGDAAERAATAREAPLRAVTLGDYEALAAATPGVSLARVHALANQHPSFPCTKAPGHVTVVVIPSLPLLMPQPSAALRAAVKTQLTRRRVLGTRVEVVGPRYLEVSVHARVRSLAGQRPERVQRDVIAALDRFLHPLEGGEDGKGWPLGRDVYRSEVLQTIDEVPGVDHVLSLDLIPAGCAPVCGNLCLQPTWLTTPGPHAIEVR